MPHALVNNRVHVIFSTKGRQELIPEEARSRLWAFIGGIARSNGFTAVAVGGTGNHAHALLAIPSTMPLAKAVQLIKGGSSKWCNENLPRQFAWQEGYAAFTSARRRSRRSFTTSPASRSTMRGTPSSRSCGTSWSRARHLSIRMRCWDELATVLPDWFLFVQSPPSDESLGCHQSPCGWLHS